MSTDDTRVKMRRSDRGMEDDWIRGFLEASLFGHLATVADGWPFVNSNLFVYDRDAHAIFLHTFRSGRTRSNLEGADRVCFAVGEMGRLLPADEALEFSVGSRPWWSSGVGASLRIRRRPKRHFSTCSTSTPPTFGRGETTGLSPRTSSSVPESTA